MHAFMYTKRHRKISLLFPRWISCLRNVFITSAVISGDHALMIDKYARRANTKHLPPAPSLPLMHSFPRPPDCTSLFLAYPTLRPFPCIACCHLIQMIMPLPLLPPSKVTLHPFSSPTTTPSPFSCFHAVLSCVWQVWRSVLIWIRRGHRSCTPRQSTSFPGLESNLKKKGNHFPRHVPRPCSAPRE